MLTLRFAWRIFAAALVVRWTYALILYGTMGDSGLLGADSVGYLKWVEGFLAQARGGSLRALDFVSPHLSLMPLAPWLWVGCIVAFGSFAVLAFVLLQGAFDAGTCLLIGGAAGSFNERFALPAAIAATVNPTQIVMSGMLYTDTLFLFFAALTLFATLRWMRFPSAAAATLIGIGLGGAALTRVLVLPWAVMLLIFLPAVAFFRGSFSFHTIRQVVAAALLFGVCIAPVLTRNVVLYGTWGFTPQSGAHFALWVAPHVRQIKDGTPWEVGAAEMQERFKREFGSQRRNPFEVSTLYYGLGKQAIAEYGVAAVIKAWLFGAAINLGSPALILSPPVLQLPRTGFYGTPGVSMPDKITNFLFRSDNALYAWLLLIGIAGVALMRLIQCIGLITVIRDARQWPAVLLMASWVGFILLVNGPVASPKYRLPIEPPLMILAGAGFVVLRDWRLKRNPQPA
jgi:hypothetical protein